VDGGVVGAAGSVVLGVCGAALVAAADEGEADGGGTAARAVKDPADAEVSGSAAAAGDVCAWTAQPAATPARASAAPQLARTRDIRRNWHHPLLSIRPPPRLWHCFLQDA
jgi:hypothetical protein